MERLAALYLDSGDRYEDRAESKRDYTDIKIVLNNALHGYAMKGGPILKTRKSEDGRFRFAHRTYFPCMKQDSSSWMESWYLLYQMRWFLKFQRRGQFISRDFNAWVARLNDSTDYVIRAEFRYIQNMIARIIMCDVLDQDGQFYYGLQPPANADIERRLSYSGDDRPFNSLNGCEPFP